MKPLLLDLIPEPIPGTAVVVAEDGRVLVRPAGAEERWFPLPGLSEPGEVEDFRRLLAAVDGRRTVVQILAALPDLEEGDILATLPALMGRLLRAKASGEVTPGAARIAVIGAGRSAAGAARALRGAGLGHVLALDVQRFPGCETAEFGELRQRLMMPPRETERPLWLQPQVPLERVAVAAADALRPFLRAEQPSDLALVALEDVPFQALLDVEAACRALGVAALFLAVEGGGAVVGPLSLPDGGCLTCSRPAPAPAALSAALPVGGTRDVSPLAMQQATARAVLETGRALAGRPDPRLLLETLRIEADGRVSSRSFQPRPSCPLCGTENPQPATALEAVAQVRTVSRLFESRPRQRGCGGGAGSVGILGGGSAGYLAALALRRKLPRLRVTVVESPRIPVIGVGEASTPLLPAFLHGTLGIDMHRFFVEARPVWKLGIRFRWGSTDFDYPFDRGLLTESYTYQGHGNAYCPSALLMAKERSNLIPLDDRGQNYAFLPAPFAYHIDNRRFVAFLRQEAERVGVEVLEREVAAAERAAGEDRIAALLTEKGDRLERDFWIDASGFRSFLSSRTLGTEFLSFASSLPTDAALAAPAPRSSEATIRPFTVAQTMNHGWCWQIALPEEDHLGYVFSTAFCSPEEAEREFRRTHPGVQEVRLIPFRCGRLSAAWRGNVFALGNAYGFVEPLESTALHMVLVAVDELIRHFPADLRADEPETRSQVNRRLGEQWDHLRGFLALHFRHNRRRDTPFWHHCRELDPGPGAEAEALFAERAPLSARPCPVDFDSLWGDFGRDVLLLGQMGPSGTRTKVPVTVSESQWRSILARGEALAERALPFAEAARVLAQRPGLLRRLQREVPWLQENRS